MKKIIFIFTIALVSNIAVKAQHAPADSIQAAPTDTVVAPPPVEEKAEKTKTPPQKPAKRFMYGAHGGVSSSFFGSSPSGYNVSSNIGFNAGIYLRVYIFKRLYVQPEINYYFSSYQFTRTVAPDLGKEDKVKTHALQIPVLVGYTLFDQKAFGLLVQTGPAVAINVGVNDNDLDITRDNFNSTYWEWIVDGQLRISRITVNGGFVAGLSNYAYGERNHSWYVGMGFSL